MPCIPGPNPHSYFLQTSNQQQDSTGGGSGVQREGAESSDGTDINIKSQGGRRDERNSVEVVAKRSGMGQLMTPEETQDDVSIHSYWKWVTTAIFDVCIINLETGFYLCMLYADDPIPGTYSLTSQRRLVLHFSFNLNQEHSKMYGFLRMRISLSLVRSIGIYCQLIPD